MTSPMRRMSSLSSRQVNDAGRLRKITRYFTGAGGGGPPKPPLTAEGALYAGIGIRGRPCAGGALRPCDLAYAATTSCVPRRTPLRAFTQAVASSIVSNSMKAKPGGDRATHTLSGVQCFFTSASSSSSLTSGSRCPMCTRFVGSPGSVIGAAARSR